MTILPWIAASFSAAGIFFNAKKSLWCWPIWIVSNFLWIWVEFSAKRIPQTLLWVGFLLANIYGWYRWKKDKNVKT